MTEYRGIWKKTHSGTLIDYGCHIKLNTINIHSRWRRSKRRRIRKRDDKRLYIMYENIQFACRAWKTGRNYVGRIGALYRCGNNIPSDSPPQSIIFLALGVLHAVIAIGSVGEFSVVAPSRYLRALGNNYSSNLLALVRKHPRWPRNSGRRALFFKLPPRPCARKWKKSMGVHFTGGDRKKNK